MIKNIFLRFIRQKFFQPFWTIVYKFALISQNYWASEVSETGELHALDSVKKELLKFGPIIIFDVGANLGQFALIAFERLKPERIYSFEPSLKTFRLLQNNIKKNGLTGIVEPQPFALSNKEDYAVLYSSHEGASTASLYNLTNPPIGFKSEFSENIVAKTIDSFCLEKNILKIGYLKIDVEGHELQVLKGAQRMLNENRIYCIQFEFGEANIDSRTYIRDFFDLLEKDFILYRIVSNGLYKIDSYNSTLEVFATINYLAINKYF